MGNLGEKKARQCLGPDDCDVVFVTTPEHRLCSKCLEAVNKMFFISDHKIKVSEGYEE